MIVTYADHVSAQLGLQAPTWNLHGPLKVHDPFVLGNDPIFKGSWRLQVWFSCALCVVRIKPDLRAPHVSSRLPGLLGLRVRIPARGLLAGSMSEIRVEVDRKAWIGVKSGGR